MPIDADASRSLLPQRVLLAGAGGHGKVVADALQSAGRHLSLSFVDDCEALWGGSILGVQVLGALCSVLTATDQVHVAIGNNVIRQRVSAGVERSRLLSVRHAMALVSDHAELGSGCFVAAGAVVGPCARVGDGVIVNHGAVVDHDCQVGHFCHIAPLASLAGEVYLGDGVLVGSGARVLPGITVGAGAVIGAGAIVLKDVPPGVTVVGVPARSTTRIDRNK